MGPFGPDGGTATERIEHELVEAVDVPRGVTVGTFAVAHKDEGVDASQGAGEQAVGLVVSPVLGMVTRMARKPLMAWSAGVVSVLPGDRWKSRSASWLTYISCPPIGDIST